MNKRVTNADIMTAINGLNQLMDSLEERISSLEGSAKKTKSSSATKSSSSKKKSTTPKYATRKEAIDAWCKEKGISKADRKAFGESKKSEREAQRKAYEATNKKFKNKVDYKVWRAEYDKQLEKFSK